MKWMQRFQEFMRGRYGSMDEINKVALSMAVVCILLSAFSWLSAIKWIGYALFIYAYFRFFSKRVYIRSNENKKFLARTKGLRTFFRIKKQAYEQRKQFVYFRCPKCKQSIRAPKGRGKIKVNCSKCHHQFVKKV